MNRENIEFAIKLMGDARALDMTHYQRGESPADSLEQLDALGNTASFVGYLALTQEFQQAVIAALAPGKEAVVHRDGSVYATFTYNGNEQALGRVADAVTTLSTFMGVSEEVASLFIGRSRPGNDQTFFRVPFGEITPEHVIDKLNELLTVGLGNRR